MMDRGQPRRAEDGGPPPKAQRNFTDPDSRIQVTRDGIIQGYNAQVAVDGAHQVIVAQRVTTNPADYSALMPLVQQTRRNCRATPKELSADAGFCSEANLAALARFRRCSAYLAPGRARHGQTAGSSARTIKPGSRMAAMALKLRRQPGARATACESRSSSRCSDRSSSREAFDSSFSAASTKPARSGR
jgi:hypothetical protein